MKGHGFSASVAVPLKPATRSTEVVSEDDPAGDLFYPFKEIWREKRIVRIATLRLRLRTAEGRQKNPAAFANTRETGIADCATSGDLKIPPVQACWPVSGCVEAMLR
ncbi:MAG: hypothetical protein DMG61_12690 [Acidobacteria bacterium]|nr:MAG: hypothetical protein DMG61_12690 [Acidobacteriota bacterium]